MTEVLDSFTREFLAGVQLSEREADALRASRGDAELTQIVVRLIRIQRLADGDPHPQVAAWKSHAEDTLDSIRSGLWTLGPAGAPKSQEASRIVLEWRQEIGDALNEVIASLGTVKAHDAAKHHKSATGYMNRAPKPSPAGDGALACDAARRWLKQPGENRIDRARRAVEWALENNDYEYDYRTTPPPDEPNDGKPHYSIGRDMAVAVVKHGLRLIGRPDEWSERRYPESRKAKLPTIR